MQNIVSKNEVNEDGIILLSSFTQIKHTNKNNWDGLKKPDNQNWKCSVSSMSLFLGGWGVHRIKTQTERDRGILHDRTYEVTLPYR